MLEELERDPHALLAKLRERDPVFWVDELDGWLVTSYELVLEAMRDAVRFTVDDPRFSTAQVIGPSMLSLDGDEHERHRTPFAGPFRAAEVKRRFAEDVRLEAERLLAEIAPRREAELRREFAGPLAAATVARALGLGREEVSSVLGWYDRIVAAVTEITAGRGDGADGREAFAELSARLAPVLDTDSLLGAASRRGTLDRGQVVANAAVLLFGGIETTEGMIANAMLELLREPARADQVRSDPRLLDAAIEESLRLEPAAAVVDRYATVDTALGGTRIARGDLVRLSIAAANRDPAVFADPDSFELGRPRSRGQLAFAQGPHVCVGVHLARLETRTAIGALLDGLPGLRLAPGRTVEVTGLVFRKPAALHVAWDPV